MKRYQPSNRADGYGEAPELFPEIHRKRSPKARREYIESTLVELASGKRLFVTDLLRQTDLQPDEIGMVIMGQRIDPDSHLLRTDASIPRELRDYEVLLRSLNGKTIRWCDGMVEGEEIMKGRAQGGDTESRTHYYRVREEWVDTEELESRLHLREAWIALKASGKFCRRAKTKAQQENLWWFEEVRPEEQAAPKRKAATA